MLKAIVLILIGSVPSNGQIVTENGGAFSSVEQCQQAYMKFRTKAEADGLAVDRIIGVCIVTPHDLPGAPS